MIQKWIVKLFKINTYEKEYIESVQEKLKAGEEVEVEYYDSNGDGVDDLAVGSYEGVLKLYTGDGHGGFTLAEDLSSLSSELGDWLDGTGRRSRALQ